MWKCGVGGEEEKGWDISKIELLNSLSTANEEA
jgi:hypothetical protein